MSRSVRMLALLAAVLACAAGRRGGERVVGVVPKGDSHIFWQTAHAGAIKAAGEFGYTVDWNAPPLEIDASRQIEIVDAMINRGVAGIVLAPVDKQGLVDSRMRFAGVSPESILWRCNSAWLTAPSRWRDGKHSLEAGEVTGRAG